MVRYKNKGPQIGGPLILKRNKIVVQNGVPVSHRIKFIDGLDLGSEWDVDSLPILCPVLPAQILARERSLRMLPVSKQYRKNKHTKPLCFGGYVSYAVG